MSSNVWNNEFGPMATSGQCPVQGCYKTIYKNSHCNGDSNHDSFGVWEIDHEYPSSKGGSDSLANKRPICCDCNRQKSDSTSARWR